MSLPAAAIAPDSGEMNPILIGPCAAASPATKTDATAIISTSRPTVRMRTLLDRRDLAADPNSERRCASSLTRRRAPTSLGSPEEATAHGTRSPAAESDDARGQALLGRPARAEAHAAQVRGVRPRVLLSARPLSALPRARHRLDPGERQGQAPRLRDRAPGVQQGVEGQAAVGAGDGRAGRGAAIDVQPRQRRARPEEDQVRHAGAGRVLEADRRDHAAALRAGAVSPVADLKALSGSVCVVGVDESDEIGNLPGKSQLTLHLEAVANALPHAGLPISDVDGIFPAGPHPPPPPREGPRLPPPYLHRAHRAAAVLPL